MRNYFNYFTEIEERFGQRRGSILFLSTLDWALIETWRDAGVPLEAVLRGIDDAFEKHETRKIKGPVRRVNGLAWCAQAVMQATEQMREAATGAQATSAAETHESGFEPHRIAIHLNLCAQQLQNAAPDLPQAAQPLAQETCTRLAVLSAEILQPGATSQVEALEATLTALEEKLLSMLLATASEEELVALRAQAAREIAPYKRKMQALQIRQIEQQFLAKRLLERYAVPRLSLFYMQSGPGA